MRRTTLAVIVLIVVAAIPVFSQASGSERPAFEVASIKPNNSDSRNSDTSTRPGGYLIATNVSLKLLIMQSFGIQHFQIVGAPDWIDTERFDIQARAVEGAVPPRPERTDPTRPTTMQLMMQ